MSTQDDRGTIIIGAGIIGLSTAYYLSLQQSASAGPIHLLEASSELFACASGRAGGFVVKDWFPPATAPLAELSFRLHKELAQEHGGRDKWGYSSSTGTSVLSGEIDGERGEDWLMDGESRGHASAKHTRFSAEPPVWLTKREGQQVEVISKGETTAQVDPLRLCKFLLTQVMKRGVSLHRRASALSVSRNEEGELVALRVTIGGGDEIDIPCSKLVLTAGAWTPRVFSALFPSGPEIPVFPLAGHSISIKSPRWNKEHESGGCHAVFATDDSGFSPEFFSRIGGEIYLAGLNDPSMPLPELTTDSRPDPDAIATLKRVARQKLALDSQSEESDLEITNESLCFRPVTTSGTPIVSSVRGESGVFLGVGHGPWGICQSLGTGKVLAEMVQGLTPSADVTDLSL